MCQFCQWGAPGLSEAFCDDSIQQPDEMGEPKEHPQPYRPLNPGQIAALIIKGELPRARYTDNASVRQAMAHWYGDRAARESGYSRAERANENILTGDNPGDFGMPEGLFCAVMGYDMNLCDRRHVRMLADMRDAYAAGYYK